MRTLYCHADVVLPDAVKTDTDVLTENGTIVRIGTNLTCENAKKVDAKDHYLMPGFIESHVHGAGGADFMDGTVDAFNHAGDTLCRHGATTIMPTTVAVGETEMFDFFDLYRKSIVAPHLANYAGIHLEGPFISLKYKGAQPPSTVRSPSKREIDRILDEAGDIVTRLTMAPELDGMEYAAKRFSDRGIQMSIGHSDAIAADVFRAWDMGFDHVTHLYCSTPGVRKINQLIYAGIPEAALLIDEMTVDLIGDGRHIPKELMQMVIKVKGVDHVILITDAMRAAGTEVKESYLGKVSPESRVIVEDGVAKLPDRSSYAGSIATMDKVLQNAVLNYGISLTDAVKMIATVPAQKFALSGKGKIETGYDADLVLTDKNLNIREVVVKGKNILA